MRKKKGFTLVELLVVIAIIALLMGILMPALARVREIAYRLICGTNLSGIGKSMLVYANDHDERFPRSGGRQGRWIDALAGPPVGWQAQDQYDAFNIDTVSNDGGYATISSCFYFLVKYADVGTDQFICNGDAGSSVFELEETPLPGWSPTEIAQAELQDFWDFGPPAPLGNPALHVSYSYHDPFYNDNTDPAASFPIRSTANPQAPVAADRNPYFDINAGPLTDTLTNPDTVIPTCEAMAAGSGNVYYLEDQDGVANSASHQNEGQNVLYADGHVNFESKPTVGIRKDNIWQCWMMEQQDASFVPCTRIWNAAFESLSVECDNVGDPGLAPYSDEDAFLINECNFE